MLEYNTDKEELDWSEFDTGKNEDIPSETRLESAKDQGLLYRRHVAEQLVGYANWVGDAPDRRSTPNIIFALGSTTIVWSRKK